MFDADYLNKANDNLTMDELKEIFWDEGSTQGERIQLMGERIEQWKAIRVAIEGAKIDAS